jgi:hypothetical protein
MAITAYEIVDGQHVAVPSPGATSPSNGAQESAPDASETGVPGATDQSQAGTEQPSASPTDTTLPGAGEAPGDTDDDEPLRDDSEVNAERLNRRFARLTAARRKAERERDALAQQHQIEIAQLRGQQEATQRLLAGAAPDMPQTPAQPTGPPQAEQFASHEEYVMAAARYGAQQEFQQRDQQMQEQRQREQQVRFQQDLMTREQAFKAEHPDFDTVVRSGLAGKVSPILQQALMLVPDGPAVAYALASQPETVQRLNTLPPPLVLVELGRLLPPASSATTPAVGSTNGHTSPPALPAPPTPLSGAGAGAPTGQWHENMSQQEYRAWRARTSQDPRWKAR